MVLVCLNKSSETQSAVPEAGAFCVNILAAKDSRTLPTSSPGRATSSPTSLVRRGASPACQCCAETLAHLECRIEETVTGGTHTVFMGRVAVATGHEGNPADVLPRPVRSPRRCPGRHGLPHRPRPGADPAVPARPAAGAHDARPNAPHSSRRNVAYALMKLAGENLVGRTSDGRYVSHAAHRRACRRPVLGAAGHPTRCSRLVRRAYPACVTGRAGRLRRHGWPRSSPRSRRIFPTSWT